MRAGGTWAVWRPRTRLTAPLGRKKVGIDPATAQIGGHGRGPLPRQFHVRRDAEFFQRRSGRLIVGVPVDDDFISGGAAQLCRDVVECDLSNRRYVETRWAEQHVGAQRVDPLLYLTLLGQLCLERLVF